MLRKWTTIPKNGRVLWMRFPSDSSNMSSQSLERRLPEDQSTAYERQVLQEWFCTEEEISVLKAANPSKETKKETRRTSRVDKAPLHSFLEPLLTNEIHPSSNLMYGPSRSIFLSRPPEITTDGETMSNEEEPLQFVDEPESPRILKHSSTKVRIRLLRNSTREDTDLVG
jgi:hypothetical protein